MDMTTLMALLQSGKRRAEYFPIRQFGFLGARRLAMTARKRLAQFQIQTCTSVQQKYQSGSEFADEASALLPSEHTSSTPTFFEWGQPKNSDVHDLWNKYLLETMQRHGTPTPTLTHGGASVSFAVPCFQWRNPKHPTAASLFCFLSPLNMAV
ncbi:hypothetical protein Emed_002986 [Eimeria media]